MIDGGNSEVIRGQSQSITLAPLSWSKDPDVDPNGPQVSLVSLESDQFSILFRLLKC